MLFECGFCGEGTRPIPHDKGDHLVIAECEGCNIVLFFTFNRKTRNWMMRNYERPKQKEVNK